MAGLDLRWLDCSGPSRGDHLGLAAPAVGSRAHLSARLVLECRLCSTPAARSRPPGARRRVPGPRPCDAFRASGSRRQPRAGRSKSRPARRAGAVEAACRGRAPTPPPVISCDFCAFCVSRWPVRRQGLHLDRSPAAPDRRDLPAKPLASNSVSAGRRRDPIGPSPPRLAQIAAGHALPTASTPCS